MSLRVGSREVRVERRAEPWIGRERSQAERIDEHEAVDLGAVLGGEARRFRPVRNRFFLPLPVEHFEELGRPGRGHPVWMARLLRIAGAARKRDDDRHFHLQRQPHCFSKYVVVRLGGWPVRMQRVPVT